MKYIKYVYILAGIVFVVCLFISLYAQEGNLSFCDRKPGYGISYKDKELCILQDISNSLKK